MSQSKVLGLSAIIVLVITLAVSFQHVFAQNAFNYDSIHMSNVALAWFVNLCLLFFAMFIPIISGAFGANDDFGPIAAVLASLAAISLVLGIGAKNGIGAAFFFFVVSLICIMGAWITASCGHRDSERKNKSVAYGILLGEFGAIIALVLMWL